MINISELIEKNRELLCTRDANANKGTYRKLLVIGGSEGMSGAAYLASVGAFRTGIGMVRIVGPECNRIILQTRLPEAMYSSVDKNEEIDIAILKSALEWADYVILGPGLSRSAYAEKLMDAVFSEEIISLMQAKELLVVDADALNIIADTKRRVGALCPNTVITPHVGEMGRLTGLSISNIKMAPDAIAFMYYKEHQVRVVLKDAVTTVVVRDDIAKIESGCGAMAKAGSGDVLCGFIAGITAVLKGDPDASVPIAAWMHGRAGTLAAAEKGCHSLLAGDIAEYAGKAMSGE